MPLARYGIIIELRENGKIYLDATNHDMPKDSVVMQLKSLVQYLEKEYNEEAEANRTFI